MTGIKPNTRKINSLRVEVSMSVPMRITAFQAAMCGFLDIYSCFREMCDPLLHGAR
jgi:hypothetical protein